MVVSVTIQTYNRSALLAETLESLHALRCPAGVDYEILVVDNNSTDATPQVLQEYRAILAPRLRSVFEPQQGLSYARNRALREAQGQIVSFLDDDVLVDPQWLTAVTAAFAAHEAAVVGGRSYLVFRTPRPAWLPEEYEFLLSKLDYGDQVLVGVDKDLFGLNFSIRKDWAVQLGGFDTSLGRQGRGLGSGEESDLLKRVRRAGGIAVYEPRAVVGHVVGAERMKVRWFLKRLFAAGKDGVTLAVKDGTALPSLAAAWLHAVRCCGSIPKGIVLGDFSSQALLGRALAAMYALGELWARLRLAVPPGLGRVG